MKKILFAVVILPFLAFGIMGFITITRDSQVDPDKYSFFPPFVKSPYESEVGFIERIMEKAGECYGYDITHQKFVGYIVTKRPPEIAWFRDDNGEIAKALVYWWGDLRKYPVKLKKIKKNE